MPPLSSIDLLLLALLLGVGVCLVGLGLSYLIEDDARQNAQNRFLSCGRHEWQGAPGALQCSVCGGKPRVR